MNTHRFDNDGYAVLPGILTNDMCEEISSMLTLLGDKGIGARGLLNMPWCARLAQLLRHHPTIAASLPCDAVAVQCTYFEKSKDQNWLVPIHQDLSIPVKRKVDEPALTGWSEKEGSIFVHAPQLILRDLVAVRLHVDECGENDGPLRIVPGSHRVGRLTNVDAMKVRDKLGEVVCTVEKGGALLIKPLVLHASSKSSGKSRRRVLHFVFGPRILPFGLRWRDAI